MERIFATPNGFFDEYGRQRIMHGVCLADKGYSLGQERHFFLEKITEQLVADIADTGFNIIRLGITWEAVEPKMGEYNERYLRAVERFMDMCAERGIYVFLDMHQDLYSHGAGFGDGAPDWANITNGAKPRHAKKVWAEGYFWGKSVHRAFDNFWDNAPVAGRGLQDRFADMWVMLAKRFSEHPAMFGFDILNEPFNGSSGGKTFKRIVWNVVKLILFSRDIKKWKLLKSLSAHNTSDCVFNHFRVQHLIRLTDALLPEIRDFDVNKYAPFFTRVATAIRSVTPHGIIMLENCYWSNIGVECSAPQPVIDGKPAENCCFAPHAYDFMVDTPDYRFADDDRVRYMFSQHEATAQRLNLPVLVGEWGGFPKNQKNVRHGEALMSFFEERLWSDTFWAYGPDFRRNSVVSVLFRPHLIAAAGIVEHSAYDASAREYRLTYVADETCTAPTVVFLPSKPQSVEGVSSYDLTPHGAKGGYTLTVSRSVGVCQICVKL